VTVKLWQLLAVVAGATFLVGLLAGRYVVPNDKVNATGREFEQHMNDAFKARRGDVQAQRRIAQRDTSTVIAPPETSPTGTQDAVRAAVPALEAWNADHGFYTDADLETLQTNYDAGLSGFHVVWATATSYCVESTAAPKYHKEGPAGEILPGSC
jgi:hypothetical protein